MKGICNFLILFLASVFAASAQSTGDSERLHRFEVEWLVAGLNVDEQWQLRFLSRRMNFEPSDSDEVRSRNAAVAALIDTPLSPTEIKVRIIGTINLLTNDPTKNRSFQFLDTFNKKGGRWRVIASSISPAPPAFGTAGPMPIEVELRRLENEWAGALVTNERSVFERIIAPEFVSTSVTGLVIRRDAWIKAWTNEGVKGVENVEMMVNVVSPDLAIVTGINATIRLDPFGKDLAIGDRFTHTWLRRDGRWNLVAAHATRLK